MSFSKRTPSLGLIYAVAIAGGLGACLRYFIGIWFYEPSLMFPWATWTCNLLGTLGLSALRLSDYRSVWGSTGVQRVLGTGFFGAFTTFSALSIETVTMLHNGRYFICILYVMSSLIAGFLMIKGMAWLIRTTHSSTAGS